MSAFLIAVVFVTFLYGPNGIRKQEENVKREKEVDYAVEKKVDMCDQMRR